MNIAIIGSGYVGLVTGACLAALGNKVVCCDNNAKKIKRLKKMIMPIYEPGLEELIKSGVCNKRLSFTSDIRKAVKKAQVIFITVGTPSLKNGEADLTAIKKVTRSIARHMDSYRLIVEKSTVPTETGERIKQEIAGFLRKKVEFDVASNPEFLREGEAINDFMHPDRIIIGVESKKAKEILLSLYKPLKAPILITDIKSAELIKHACNSFLATKISFINVIAHISDIVGADVDKVADGMGFDKRIGRGFLNAGIGYGGACFPKDVDAFIRFSEKCGYDFKLLRATREINQQQKGFFLEKVRRALGGIKEKNIAVFGLSYKPDTDDIRNSPAIEIIKKLVKEQARVRAYDPQAMPKAKEALGAKISFSKDPYEACRGSECLLLLTEWDEFKELDFSKIKKLLKKPLLIDGRNVYDPMRMKKLGFIYVAMGKR